jgi:hypothetical protein
MQARGFVQPDAMSSLLAKFLHEKGSWSLEAQARGEALETLINTPLDRETEGASI